MRSFLKRAAVIIGTLAFASMLPQAAFSQNALVPQDFLTNKRLSTGDRIRYCLNMSSVLVEFDREIGREIAGALFLEPEFFEVKTPTDPYPLDYRMDVTEEDLFIFMNRRCDAFLGFSISPDDTPDWLQPTRPYHSTAFRIVATRKDVRALADLPASSSVGTWMGSSPDSAFRVFLSTSGASLRRLPYPHNLYLVDRLRDGTLQAAMIWEPALYLGGQGGPQKLGLSVLNGFPFTVATIDFGIALRSNESYLRAQLDSAIDALVRDGTLEKLRRKFSLPPQAQ